MVIKFNLIAFISILRGCPRWNMGRFINLRDWGDVLNDQLRLFVIINDNHLNQG